MVVGCSQSNESKIVGTWRTLPVDDNSRPGMTLNGVYTFFKGGGIKIEYRSELSDPSSWPWDYAKYTSNTGKYKFEDENNVSYTTNMDPMTIKSVSFPEKDRMKFGNQELGRIK
jgi:hypothetical protein